MYTTERLKWLIQAHTTMFKEFFNEELWQSEFDQEAEKYINFAANWGQPPTIHVQNVITNEEKDLWIFFDGDELKFKFKEYIRESLF